MSPIGRIFVVLNLILSAIFLGWASTALGTVNDYKQQLETAKSDHLLAIDGKDKEISALTVDNNAISEQQRQFREQRDQLQAEVDRQKTQMEELQRSNDGMQANLTKIEATLGDYNSTIASLTQQKDAATERAHEAERQRDDAAQKEQEAQLARSAAEEATNSGQLMIADLEKERDGLKEQVTQLETRIGVIVAETGIELGKFMAQPKIDAAVLDVNKDLKLVVLNKGAKDQVKVGMTFDVYRGSQYKGQVRIQDVQDSLSSGLILTAMNPIDRGDSATTRL